MSKIYKKVLDILYKEDYDVDDMLIHIAKKNPTVFVDTWIDLYMPFTPKELFDYKIIKIMMQEKMKIPAIKKLRELGIESGLRDAKDLIDKIESKYVIHQEYTIHQENIANTRSCRYIPNTRSCRYIFPSVVVEKMKEINKFIGD